MGSRSLAKNPDSRRFANDTRESIVGESIRGSRARGVGVARGAIGFWDAVEKMEQILTSEATDGVAGR